MGKSVSGFLFLERRFCGEDRVFVVGVWKRSNSLLVFRWTRLGFLGVGWQWVKVLRLRFFEVNPLGHAIRVGFLLHFLGMIVEMRG
jgi:hypothetical protein